MKRRARAHQMRGEMRAGHKRREERQRKHAEGQAAAQTRDGRQGLKFARWETQLGWSPGEDRASNPRRTQPELPPGAEAGRGRLGGRSGARCEEQRWWLQGPGGGPALREGKAGGSGRGGEAGAGQRAHLKSLSLDVIFSKRLEMWKAAVLMVAAPRGRRREGIWRRGPLPRRTRAALG